MGSGKKKIEIKKITKHSSRMVTFSKRRKGLFKKAHELQTRTGANVAIVVFSPAGKPHSYGDTALINAALGAWLGSCSKDNGASSSNGGDGEVVGCDRIMLREGYDGGFGGANSSGPAAIARVVSNVDVMGCNGVNAGYGGLQIATSSSVDMMGCNGVDAGCYGGLQTATSSVDMMSCNGVNVDSSVGFESAISSANMMGCNFGDIGYSGGFECATSSADMMGCNGVNVGFYSTTYPVGCATEEVLNASWDVEAYSDFEVEALLSLL